MINDRADQLPDPDYSPPPLPPSVPRWKRFAWDGWDLEIPVEWDLGALEASAKAGYFRLDDEFEPRLMLKWQPLQGRFDPKKAIERYLKKYSKNKEPIKAYIGARVPGIRNAFKEHNHETYALSVPSEPSKRSWGIAAHCQRCRRAFVLEMSTDDRVSNPERLVSRVLGSFSEHPDGRFSRWEAYGLSFDLPIELRAAGSSFRQGFVSMAAAERGRKVEVSRWTLASTHLDGNDLRRFLAVHLARTRGMPRLRMEEALVLSHPGLHFHSPRHILDGLQGRLRRGLALHRPGHVTGLIWHCSASNRIFMLTLGSNYPNDIGQARLLASRVRCCKVIF